MEWLGTSLIVFQRPTRALQGPLSILEVVNHDAVADPKPSIFLEQAAVVGLSAAILAENARVAHLDESTGKCDTEFTSTLTVLRRRVNGFAVPRLSTGEETKQLSELGGSIRVRHQADSVRQRRNSKPCKNPKGRGSIRYEERDHLPTPRLVRMRSSALGARIGIGTPVRPVAS